MKRSLQNIHLALALAAVFGAGQSVAAECNVASLDANKLAGLYQGAAQHLAQLYTLSKTAQDEDVRMALQAQGPLSTFGDSTYLISDLLKLRSSMVNEKDRKILDEDIKANLDLIGPALLSAEDYLGALEPKTQNLDLSHAIGAARQQIADGILVYGACISTVPPPPPR